MSRSVHIAEQVADYARCLAPEPRQAVKRALTELREERGDIRPLEAKLTGFYRLRVGRFRLIFAYLPEGTIEVLFMEERQLVYELFEAQFIQRLKA